jgi:hypothetical protein
VPFHLPAFLYFSFYFSFYLSVCSPRLLAATFVDVGLFGNCKPSEWHGGTRAVGLLLTSFSSRLRFPVLNFSLFFLFVAVGHASSPCFTHRPLFSNKFQFMQIVASLLAQILRFLVALTCCTLSNEPQLSANLVMVAGRLSTGHVSALQVRNSYGDVASVKKSDRYQCALIGGQKGPVMAQ